MHTGELNLFRMSGHEGVTAGSPFSLLDLSWLLVSLTWEHNFHVSFLSSVYQSFFFKEINN